MYCPYEVCLAPMESTLVEHPWGHPSAFDTQEGHAPSRSMTLGEHACLEIGTLGEHPAGEDPCRAPLEGTLGARPFSILHPGKACTSGEQTLRRAPLEGTLGGHPSAFDTQEGHAPSRSMTLGEHAIHEILTFCWCSYVARKNTPLYAGRKGDF